MSRIMFIKMDDDGEAIEIKVDGDKTWDQLTEDFIRFLKGCGYQITHDDIADYLQEQSDVGSEIEDNWLDEWAGDISDGLGQLSIYDIGKVVVKKGHM